MSLKIDVQCNKNIKISITIKLLSLGLKRILIADMKIKDQFKGIQLIEKIIPQTELKIFKLKENRVR
jgi:hypothetical protein